MRIAVGSDHRGRRVRVKLTEYVRRLGHDVEDGGDNSTGPVDYPDVVSAVVGRVSKGDLDRAILVGGTGIGMSIAANKFPGVRAAVCHDEMTAEMSRRHNDLNVLCLPADLQGDYSVCRVVSVWLATPFEGGRHARRLEKIVALEARFAENSQASEAQQTRRG